MILIALFGCPSNALAKHLEVIVLLRSGAFSDRGWCGQGWMRLPIESANPSQHPDTCRKTRAPELSLAPEISASELMLQFSGAGSGSKPGEIGEGAAAVVLVVSSGGWGEGGTPVAPPRER